MNKTKYSNTINFLKLQLKDKDYLDIDLTNKTVEFLENVAKVFEYDYVTNTNNKICLRIYNQS